MNLQKILFPTDFSHYNDAALKLASSLAAETHATLHIVHVHEVQDVSIAAGEAAYLYDSTWQEAQREAESRLKNIAPTSAGVNYEHACLTGNPVEEILAFAKSQNADLIVMASHGRTGLQRLLMGSIAEGVMRRAACPVLIVKQPTDETGREGTVTSHAGETGR